MRISDWSSDVCSSDLKPVLAAPAMKVRMWLHAATRRNVATLRRDGVTVMEPDEGEMACGEYGPGRLPQPDAIKEAIDAGLANAPAVVPRTGQPGFAPANHRPLYGRAIASTARPPHETTTTDRTNRHHHP